MTTLEGTCTTGSCVATVNRVKLLQSRRQAVTTTGPTDQPQRNNDLIRTREPARFGK
jgi:hypothetical protein